MLICTKANSQDSLTTKLINTAAHEIVDFSFKYYYLLDYAPNAQFTKQDLSDVHFEIKNYDKSIPLPEFADKIASDTSIGSWRSYTFEKAKIIDEKQRPKYSPSSRLITIFYYTSSKDSLESLSKIKGDIIIPIKQGTSKKQIEQIKQKTIAAYENKPVEEKTYFIFSKPIYSSSRDYALLTLQSNNGGCTYVFKLIDGSWRRVLGLRRWVY